MKTFLLLVFIFFMGYNCGELVAHKQIKKLIEDDTEIDE